MRKKAPIRTLIVDDEPLARRRLQSLLGKDSEVLVVGSCASGLEALKLAHEQSPDLIFLDVQMPRMDGFEFLRAMKLEKLPQVIFVTAYDAYALQAFEVSALDYLLKPFDDERFRKALLRAKERLFDQSGIDSNDRILSLLETLQPKSRSLDRVLIKMGERAFFLRTDEIDWIEAEGKYVRLHAGQRSYLLREGIGELELQLDAEKFLRIHRSTIVNIDRIKEMHPWFHGDYEIILLDGTRLSLSRRYRVRLKGLAGNSL